MRILNLVLQAPTAQVKTTWVNEIRKVLTTQLEAYRGTTTGTHTLETVYTCTSNLHSAVSL